MPFAPLHFRAATFDWTRTYVVGVVNATPDSFSDGGMYLETEAAYRRSLQLIEDGADIIDIGGESTRPQGATRVAASEEMERVVPVIRALRDRETVISVDTTKAVVAAAAVEAGAEIVNDISGGNFDPDMVRVVAETGAAFVCGHVRGRDLAEVHAATEDESQEPPDYEEVAFALAQKVARLPAALRCRTIVDPGLGFGKGTTQNLSLIRRAGELGAGVACPVMVGPSRKRFLGELTGLPVDQRDSATVGAALAAVASGAQLVRVHDVKLLKPALVVYEAIRGRVG